MKKNCASSWLFTKITLGNSISHLLYRTSSAYFKAGYIYIYIYIYIYVVLTINIDSFPVCINGLTFVLESAYILYEI